ncbi:MAG: BREX-1 system adenine-specific DNA-methyltransferase PglX, partial [Coriobacteriia bacterium]|nr:BREX-1 system adenine-specific DNA-methyltransferase PglX [Coriobacteriia bacterium]
MDTAAIEKYSIWARRALIEGVKRRAWTYRLTPENRSGVDAYTTVAGAVLSNEEIAQRCELLRRLDEEPGTSEEERYESFVERQAFSWFNRFVAIRFMEVNDFLPAHTRIFSDASDAFEPQVLREATSLDLPGLSRQDVLVLKTAGDDEALFRALLIAQCNQLAECLPEVFARVGAGDALMLPDGLLRADSVVGKLVTDLPARALADEEGSADVSEDEDNTPLWSDEKILGWMYQFYNTELKDEAFAGFKKGKKADARKMGPATQLFTPDWIVRYMVENTLGRLWMLSHPDSTLRERMAYYIEPGEGAENVKRVSSPEEITLCDPACGSAHILDYAFELLYTMYEEVGYSASEIPSLILTKNLHGMEIDERAAQIAVLVLSLAARRRDRRFFSRGVRPDIRVLTPVEFDEEERAELGRLADEESDLFDAVAHLGEVGSLLRVTPVQIASLREARNAAVHSLLDSAIEKKLDAMLYACEAVSRTFDLCVANPPYMGSSNFGPWLSKWIKTNYPTVKSDLFSSFIVRICEMAGPDGDVGMMTPFVWMFIGSYEKLRAMMIDEKTITSLVQLEYSGFAGATVPICTFTFHNSHIASYKGGYVRLSEFVGAAVQAPKTRTAIADPTCGYFYRADASTFKDIPGTPIAYWASDSMRKAFHEGMPLSDLSDAIIKGIFTGNNDNYLRRWFEISNKYIGNKWSEYTKGGAFRRWFGNQAHVVWWADNGKELREFSGSGTGAAKYFNNYTITWSKISSSLISFRYNQNTIYFDDASPAIILKQHMQDTFIILAFLNSNIIKDFLYFISPTLNFQVGSISLLPFLDMNHSKNIIEDKAK